MRNAEYNKMQVIKFLLWTFSLSYIIQIGAAYLYNKPKTILTWAAVCGIFATLSTVVCICAVVISIHRLLCRAAQWRKAFS